MKRHEVMVGGNGANAAGKGLPALPGNGAAHGSMGGRAARPLAAESGAHGVRPLPGDGTEEVK